MNSIFSKGSIWRKWDLQVQTRLDNHYKCLGTSLDSEKLEKLIKVTGLTETEIIKGEKSISADKYAKFFVNYVTLFTDISVIGITDHNTGKELDYLIEESKKTEGNLTIIPGVEITSTHGIHILCLFDPEKRWKENWTDSIAHFMTEIGLTGELFNSNKQPNNATKTSQEIMEIVEKKNGICIFAHITTDNGLFNRSLPTANGGAAHKDIYTHRLCQIVQIPHSGNIPIGTQDIIEGKDPNYNNKSVTKIKCSDARNLSKIGTDYSWIKADTTFYGLKQIIFEPTDRVKNQKQHPYEDKRKIYFDSLKLSGSKNFVLPDLDIPLNRELVALIGGRGCGKSVLLDTFAFLNEKHLKFDKNEKKKVIEYYRDNEGRTEPPPHLIIETILINKDKQKSKHTKVLSNRENLELPFLYLGQEQLSSIATNDRELTHIICDLIGIDINESGQEELKSQARNILGNINSLQQGIRDIIERYQKLGYTNGTDLETWINDYLSRLVEQQKRLSSEETKQTLLEINKITIKGFNMKEAKERINNLELKLKNLNIAKEIASFNNFIREIYPDNVSIENIDVNKQLTALNSLKEQVESDRRELEKEILILKKEFIQRGIKEDIVNLVQANEHLQIKINNIKKDFKSYKQLKQQLENLYIRKREMLNRVKRFLTNLQNNIIQGFQIFKNSHDNSILEEKELFIKLIEGIEIEGKIDFNFKNFAAHVLDEYIDNRRISNENDLKKIIAGTNPDGTSKEVNFDNLLLWMQKNNLETHKYFSRNGWNRFMYYVFTKWSEFFSVKAVAKLNGKPTEILSIGQRGTLLLKVYLATATDKQVFIIDQPEDNLDNNFIVNELVPLIRKAKQSRQIIMSTHNANLVVNADAEQVIVARLDQGLDYLSGSIENSKINRNIKNILEGGEKAFRQRERKYLLVK